MPTPEYIARTWKKSSQDKTAAEKAIDTLVAEIRNLGLRNNLLGEIIATLSIEPNHQYISAELRPLIDSWRKRIDLEPVDWKTDVG